MKSALSHLKQTLQKDKGSRGSTSGRKEAGAVRVDNETFARDERKSVMHMLKQLEKGTETSLEATERAMLEEHGFLKEEHARLVAKHGASSVEATTVENMISRLRQELNDLMAHGPPRNTPP